MLSIFGAYLPSERRSFLANDNTPIKSVFLTSMRYFDGLSSVRDNISQKKQTLLSTLITLLLLASCQSSKQESSSSTSSQKPIDVVNSTDRYLNSCPIAHGFDFPVGPPNAKGYYDAQPFRSNDHLGEDWNGVKGGNSDLGDPIYSIADGMEFFAGYGGPGWGNVIRIYHNTGTKEQPVFIESLYGHLLTLSVKDGDIVNKGQLIGTMGNADGVYYAHLHLEIRDRIGMPLGGGYSKDTTGFVSPT